MPKDLVGIATIIVISFFFIYSTVVYGADDSKRKDLVSNMSQTVQSAASTSFDYASRVSDGNTQIDQTTFESTFKTKFDKNNNINLGSHSFHFDYLRSGSNTKAIRVTLTDSSGTKYTSTVALDVNPN